VKTRSYIVMMVLVCLTVMSVYAAQEGTKNDVSEPQTTGQATAPKAETLKTEVEKVSYIIGTQIAGNFKLARLK